MFATLETLGTVGFWQYFARLRSATFLVEPRDKRGEHTWRLVCGGPLLVSASQIC